MNQALVTTLVTGKQLRITLNRAEKANALNGDMLNQLELLFLDAAVNPDVNAVVITGGGKGAFCAGADMDEPDTMNNTALWESMSGALAALPVLTIAMINGACIGGGLVLALGCDVRVGVPDAQFGYPLLKNRLLPGKQEVNRLHTLTGPGRCNLLLLGGQRIDAAEALAWGLLDRMVSADQLYKEVGNICQTACNSERHHVVKMKNKVLQGSGYDARVDMSEITGIY